MSTETRIGIVAGLLIVVVASVYFFYGNGKREDDLLIAANPKVAPAKIPLSNEPSKRAPQVQTTARPTPAPLRPPQVTTYQPARPGAAGVQAPAPARTEPVGLIGPPAETVAGLSGIDRYRLTPPIAPSNTPAESPAASTLLRTSPSPSLIEATRQNLGERPTGAPTDPSTAKPAGSALLDAPAPRVILKPETLGASPQTGAEWPKTHVAAKGDTFESLAKQYYNDAKRGSEIIAANPSLKRSKKLKPGTTITIPAPGEKTAETGLSLDQLPSPSGRTYTVLEGDTFYGIAGKTIGDSKRWKEIFELNKDMLKGDPRRLKPGMVLRLPG